MAHSTRTDTVIPIPGHTACGIGSHLAVSMNIDMTLATSYKPVLVCIVKVCILMAFHYTSMPILFVTERYALMVAIVYIDKWLAHEYIVNTNSCVAVLAGSLLVHELRDSGVQERLHGEFAHNVVLSMLVVSNILALALGEKQYLLNRFVSTPRCVNTETPSLLPPELSDANNKRPRQQLHVNNPNGMILHSKTPNTIGAFACVLLTSILLVVLSTCAMPVSTHDPFLNNLRVWSFTVLSLTWLYTINYKNLRYSIVAPFTPCLLRFSCILFLTPTLTAIVGIVLVSGVLAATHTWITNQQQPQCDMFLPDYTNPVMCSDSVSVVMRETKTPSHTQTGSVISYRTPSVIKESSDSVVASVKNTSTSVVVGLPKGVIENTNSYATKPDLACKIDHHDVDSIVVPIPDASIDYDSMFLQAMSERAG